MVVLVLGLALWWAAHGLKIFAPAKRAELTERLGEGPSKGLMAALLVGSVVLMTIGYQRADFVNLWYPPEFLRHVNNLLMVAAVGVFVAGTFRSGVRRVIRHPQLTGLKIWAAAHLLVNGDLASVILFGGLLAWGVVAMIGLNRRDGKKPLPGEGTWLGAGLHAGVTLGLFVVIALVHNWLGVWPFGGTPPA